VLNDFERTKLAWAQLRTLLVDFDALSLKPDEVTNVESVSDFFVVLVLLLHLFFEKSKSSFGIGMGLCKVIEPLVQFRHVAAFTNVHSEVGAIAIDKFERRLEGAGVYTRVKGKFHSREVFSPVFLTFVTKESKVLLYFLVFMLNFAITFRVIDSSEASFDTKTLVESIHKLGCKLQTTIGEDFLWSSVEAEDVPIVKIGSALSC
jgi:hypothetical protein